MIYNRKKFFDAVRKSFGPLKQSQVDGFNFILSAWEREYPKGDVRYLAYPLATTWHETAATMQPIEEYGRGKGRKYGPTGFWGRGYVQLTWDYNYKKASEKLKALYGIDVDLVKNPEKALDPQIAVLIMFAGMIEGWFTGRRLAQYFNSTVDDPENARRIINGTDRAAKIAGYHKAFLAALKEAQQVGPVASPEDRVAPEAPTGIVIVPGPKKAPDKAPNPIVTLLILLRDWLTGK